MSPPTVIEKPAEVPAFGKDFKSAAAIIGENHDYELHLQKVVEKLRTDPTTITPDDARRLHEHFNATDKESARLISAIEAVACANDELASVQGDTAALAKSGHASLMTIVEDLVHAVESNPKDVTIEVLKLTQNAVSRMQKALGSVNAPQPELEAELQEEYAKIEPKVEQGTVTKAEADHLHSLEARAHGHTEKGGLTAVAQSIAAKRERQLSLSEGSGDTASNDVNVSSLNDKAESLALADKTTDGEAFAKDGATGAKIVAEKDETVATRSDK